jgi:hypothetical protein
MYPREDNRKDHVTQYTQGITIIVYYTVVRIEKGRAIRAIENQFSTETVSFGGAGYTGIERISDGRGGYLYVLI